MEIERLLKLEETDKDKIEMIISNNLDLMYKGKAAVTIDNWNNLVNEILAWRDYEAEKLTLTDVSTRKLPFWVRPLIAILTMSLATLYVIYKIFYVC